MIKNNSKTDTTIIGQVKGILSEQLGIDNDDIKETDRFLDHLHMSPSDVSEFLEKISELGYDTSKIELSDFNSIEDIIEIISSQENI